MNPPIDLLQVNLNIALYIGYVDIGRVIIESCSEVVTYKVIIDIIAK